MNNYKLDINEKCNKTWESTVQSVTGVQYVLIYN